MPPTKDLPLEPLVKEPATARKRVDVEWIRGMVNLWIEKTESETAYGKGYRRALCQLLDEILDETNQSYGWDYLKDRAGLQEREDGTYHATDNTHRYYLTREQCEKEHRGWMKIAIELQEINANKRQSRKTQNGARSSGPRSRTLRLPPPTVDPQD